MFLSLIDADLIMNSLFRSIGGLLNRNEVGDDINHQVRLVFVQLSVPTFMGKVAKYAEFIQDPANKGKAFDENAA